jgi:adenylosuccinate synthase
VLAKVYNQLPSTPTRSPTSTSASTAPPSSPYIADTVNLVHEALEAGQHVLFEGAQATFLDLDHGTYPFVTSSNPVAGGAAPAPGRAPPHRPGHRHRQGLRHPGGRRAVPHRAVRRGRRPHRRRRPRVRHQHRRRRRPGWFDAVMLRHAVRLNSLSELAITKLDVLDTFDTVKVCVAYESTASGSSTCPTTSRCSTRHAGLRGAARLEDRPHRVTEPHQLPAAARTTVDLPRGAGRRAHPPGRGRPRPRPVRPLRRVTP